MQSEKLEYDNKINYGKLMPRRAENFGMPTDYRRNPRTSVWFPSVVACYLFWKMPIFLIPLGFGFFFAKRNKVQTHPPTLPSPLRILIVPVTAAKRNKRSMSPKIRYTSNRARLRRSYLTILHWKTTEVHSYIRIGCLSVDLWFK